MRQPAGRFNVLEYASAMGVVAVATGVCLGLRAHLAIIDVAMVLLLGVVVTAATHRRGPALAVAVISIVAFDALFVPPYYTLHVLDSAYYLTFGVMIVVALTMGGLTARIRTQLEATAERERRASTLYAVESELAAAGDLAALQHAAASHLGRLIGGTAHILLSDTTPAGGQPALPADSMLDDSATRVAAAWAWTSRKPTGWSTPHGHEIAVMLVPLVARSGPIGLAVLVPSDATSDLPPADMETLTAMISLVADACERRQLAVTRDRARHEVEAERLRTALLSSLSHDLRTPLAAIEGSASSLLEDAGRLPRDVQRDLLQGILDESSRMARLVRNLLDMVRVETGTLAVQRSWQPLEEPLGVALVRTEDRLRGHPVATHLPADLPMVSVDELLIEQVFINLLENAARYTPPGTPIEVSAWREDESVLVEVADHGSGVPAGQEEVVFSRFYRGNAPSAADAGAGAGLGLTICRGIVTAHGGRIWIGARGEGGAAVRFTLPCAGAPVQVPDAEVSAG
jgi:two-component system sensor histidine kinase KdpD